MRTSYLILLAACLFLLAGCGEEGTSKEAVVSCGSETQGDSDQTAKVDSSEDTGKLKRASVHVDSTRIVQGEDDTELIVGGEVERQSNELFSFSPAVWGISSGPEYWVTADSNRLPEYRRSAEISYERRHRVGFVNSDGGYIYVDKVSNPWNDKKPRVIDRRVYEGGAVLRSSGLAYASDARLWKPEFQEWTAYNQVIVQTGEGPLSITIRPGMRLRVRKGTDQVFPDSTALGIAILRSDGTLFPLGQQAGGVWFDQWTDIFWEEIKPPMPDAELPKRWEVIPVRGADSSRSVPDAIRLTRKKIAQMNCQKNYIYGTDWAGSDGTETIGLALTDSLTRVQEEEIASIQELRADNGIAHRKPYPKDSVVTAGEYEPQTFSLGYFALDGDTLGVFETRGYESSDFSIYQFRSGSAEKVAEKSGGGC